MTDLDPVSTFADVLRRQGSMTEATIENVLPLCTLVHNEGPCSGCVDIAAALAAKRVAGLEEASE